MKRSWSRLEDLRVPTVQVCSRVEGKGLGMLGISGVVFRVQHHCKSSMKLWMTRNGKSLPFSGLDSSVDS